MGEIKQIREPIATWWKIGHYRAEIEPVEVVAFTTSFVTFLSKWGASVLERRERRDDIFPSFLEAKEEMVRRAEVDVKEAKDSLQEARSFLGQVESLKEPEGK
jgi:hypothetical protein